MTNSTVCMMSRVIHYTYADVKAFSLLSSFLYFLYVSIKQMTHAPSYKLVDISGYAFICLMSHRSCCSLNAAMESNVSYCVSSTYVHPGINVIKRLSAGDVMTRNKEKKLLFNLKHMFVYGSSSAIKNENDTSITRYYRFSYVTSAK